MSGVDKASILARVESSPVPKRAILRELGVPKSTYYRWLKRPRLDDRRGGSSTPWNRLTPQEQRSVLAVARHLPELSCRQLAAWITDNQGFSVSESTVYRILREEGLIKSPEMQLEAGKEYHRKTTGPHQMWATDASYFKVIGWGYYYMVTVMDEYSRFILAHKLQRDMTSDSFIEVVQKAVDHTGMTEIPVENRTRLLSDNGSGYVSRAFNDYLAPGGYQAHSGSSLSSSDQWQAGALSPEYQAGRQSGPLRVAIRSRGGHRSLCHLLQLLALSHGAEQCHAN